MLTLFRTDASHSLGAGHVMRCLTLADALAEQGAECRFICRDQAGHLGKLIAERGHGLHLLPGQAMASDASQSLAIASGLRPDWLVVDHYALDRHWESAMRPHSRRLLVIDDLADRPHACDLLLDQNLHPLPHTRYAGKVDAECPMLLGPHYALLRPEFASARGALRQSDGTVRRIFVCFGGSDPFNHSTLTLTALQSIDRPEIAADIVAGPLVPFLAALQAACDARPNTTLHIAPGNMASLMASADLAIGAGGSMNWERCCLGLPSIVLAIADNQRSGLDALESAGCLFGWRHGEAASSEDIAKLLRHALSSPERLMKMRQNALTLVDADGARRVADAMLRMAG